MADPTLTDDELMIIFEWQGSDVDLYHATRSSTLEPFGPPVALDELNTIGYTDGDPSISADGITLVFARVNPVSASNDIFIATRPSLLDRFEAPIELVVANTAAQDKDPAWADENTFLFESDGHSLGMGRDIFIVMRASTDDPYELSDCPGDWVFEEIDSSTAVCENPKELVDSCAQAPAFFDSPLEEYDEVRGFVRAYQWGSTDGFGQREAGIDECYVEGISITYGAEPRQHIWTLAAGLTSASGGGSCPCLGDAVAPRILGDNYYCDTGNTSTEIQYGIWFTSEPLWAGGQSAGCETLGDPAWFEARLDAPTDEPIEVRLMQGGGPDENIGLKGTSGRGRPAEAPQAEAKDQAVGAREERWQERWRRQASWLSKAPQEEEPRYP